MNRRRLEVEAWRDAMLAVSGEPRPRRSAARRQELVSTTNRRRTLYAAVSRHDLDGLLRLFDFPDPNITSDRRAVTTVPLAAAVRARTASSWSDRRKPWRRG